MNSRRRGLGSGLDALLPTTLTEQAIRMVPIDAIRPNRHQPRVRFDEQALSELAASIQEHGVLQPLIVANHPDGGYELIAGERRWRAAQLAGTPQVPVLIKEATSQQLLEIALVENVQRSDLNALEEGEAYQSLKDEFGLTDDQIAQRVGKSRVAIVNSRRLIHLLPSAKSALLEGTISAGHGRALLRMDVPEEQSAALSLIVRREMNVREAERLAEYVVHKSIAPQTRQALLMGAITLTQTQSLLRFMDEFQQAEVLDVILAHNLGARETERLCELVDEGVPINRAIDQMRGRSIINPPVTVDDTSSRSRKQEVAPTSVSFEAPTPASSTSSASQESSAQNPEDAAIVRMLEEALGTPVSLSRSGRAIRLTLTLYSDEQLQALYDLVSGGK